MSFFHTARRPSLRTLTLLCALGAGACGGPVALDDDDDDDDDPTPTQYTVGGSLSGADGAVTLSLNGVESTFTGTSFTFAATFVAGSPYGVQFVSSATGQSCTVTGGIGVISANVTNVQVVCTSAMVTLRFDDAEVTGQVATGDLDGDGVEDVVFTIRTLPGHVSGANNDMFRVLFGTGGGQFTGQVDVSRLGSSDSNERGHQLLALELSGDASDDIVISTGFALEVFGGGATRTPSRIFAPGGSGAPLRTLDADGNGSQDLVSIVFGGSNLNYFNLYRNNGDGTFGAEEFFGNRDDAEAQALGMGTPLNMVTGRFDDDDIDDVLAVVLTGTGTSASLALALFSGNGSGGFTYPAALDALSDDLFLGFFAFEEPSKEIAAGDFDGDGDLDVAITSTTDFLQILTNDGQGSFTASSRVTVEERPIHVRTADFDQDGTLDLLSVNADDRTLVIAFGQGSATFGAEAGGEAVWRSIQLDSDVDLFDVVVSDIDGDGTPDITLAEDGTNPPDTGRGSVQIFLGPGG